METYWITGVQLGMLLAYCRNNEREEDAEELVNKIIDKQEADDKVRKQ